MLILKIKDVTKFVSSFLLANLLKLFGFGKDIWVITERRSECKDNGYHFFKYMREEHPQKKVFYAIDKNSAQLNKISHLGNVLYFNSFRHYLYAFLANRLIGAFNPVGIPDSFSFYKFPKLIKGKRVYLKHGIFKEYIEKSTYQYTKYHMLCCGAAPEYDYVKSHFGYPTDVVKYLGLCRYDNLSKKELKRKILVMPTWRQYLPSQTWKMKSADDSSELEREFLNSDYYAHYSSLLKNQNLLNFLEEKGYDLVFYLHHELQQFTSLFTSDNKNIILANNNEYDVQSLLKESEILITDYSSVAFDFAYMNKPLLYYQFDEEDYYKSHYSIGYFDYKSMGFGYVAKSERDLINILFDHYDADKKQFSINDKFLERSDKFFTIKDNLNCKRTYDAIVKL